MFSPKWKKEAKHLVKGARKFIQYKRDLLDESRIGEIESRQEDLLEAIRKGDREEADEASKHLRATCENSLPRERPLNWLEENVEVMFVAIVIALGLRAYYLQPFRIPTGSMQPTLNGINGHYQAEEEWPSLPKRIAQKILKGRSYVKVVNDRDRKILLDRKGQPVIQDTQRFHFFSRSLMGFEGDKPMWLPAPARPCREAGLDKALEIAARNNLVIPKGTVICEGYIDTGDLVLVNKFAYHFRKPKRGETFVFDTQGITGIYDRSDEQSRGSHYIKRLCGVPGDELRIDDKGHLLINGSIAKEPGIQRVMEAKGAYGGKHEDGSKRQGYTHAKRENPGPKGQKLFQYIAHEDDTLELDAVAPPGMREYAALGDNTGSSLDSRYWGSVKEFNLVGPALFTLWPFTSGHWGFID